MGVEQIQTLVIGGGQAGLAMSHRLKQRGLAHLVVERHRIAERWRTERWDGLMFQFPNWSVSLPEFAFPHTEPDAFATTGEIVQFIEAYAAFVAPPIRCGVAVTRLRRRDGATGFVAETSGGVIEAENVVVATGPYQGAVMPDLLRGHAVFQVHASRYRNPDQLPPGAVLVEARGPSRLLPLITGAYGGHTIDFRRFAADGVTLLGRVRAARDGVLDIAPDLGKSLVEGEATFAIFLGMVDAHVEKRGLKLLEEPAARAGLPDPACVTEPLRRLDIGADGIGAVIWATGYALDFGWIDIPVLDARGEPLHRHGIAEVPGLYFLGLQWLSKMKSSFLSGVGDDAAVLANHIAARN